MTQEGVIGRDNALPWRLPEDLKHFKAVTMGKPVLMGRKTFESIGKPLPGRTNVVLTRDSRWRAEGVEVVSSIAEALERTQAAPEVAGIGGAEIFRVLLPLAARIYLTRVHAIVAGDTYFPATDWTRWRELERREYAADERNQYDLTFVTLETVAADAR
jgi:dihydrofolate reductase